MPEEIKELLDCRKCKLKECIGCEITYTDRKKIMEYIEGIEHSKDIMQKALEMQAVGWNEGARLYAEKQKLIEKLEEDIRNDYHMESIIGDRYLTIGVQRHPVKKYAEEILAILKGEKEV